MTDENQSSPIVDAKAGFALDDLMLRAYSPERYVLCQRLGMLWPYPGEGATAQMIATGLYPGMMNDIAILFWVLTLPKASEQTAAQTKAREWNTSRAMQKPQEAGAEALEWAAYIGIMDPKSEKGEAAMEKFFDIVKPAEDAKFTTEGNTGGEEESGPKL